MEYLSRAAMNAKSGSSNLNDGQLLDQLEEKLEVCNLQVQVLEAMTALNNPDLQIPIDRLSHRLMDISMVSSFPDYNVTSRSIATICTFLFMSTVIKYSHTSIQGERAFGMLRI